MFATTGTSGTIAPNRSNCSRSSSSGTSRTEQSHPAAHAAERIVNEIDPLRLERLPVGKVSMRDTDKLTDDYAAMKRHNFLDERWSMIRRNHHLHHICCRSASKRNSCRRRSRPVRPIR
ncbi:hypothetical protein ACFFNY_04945 [Paenibacillus hodogayensis]|uniref:Uncharacterized protein n=1 Tax=Paenibacillus hodogayensis TaxID=279208 RepID=A0ABV5VRL1_9BACL